MNVLTVIFLFIPVGILRYPPLVLVYSSFVFAVFVTLSVMEEYYICK